MPTENVRISGLKELTRAFREISPQIKGNQLRNAARAMTVPVIEQAKINAKRIDDPKTKQDISATITKRLIPINERDAATKKGDSVEVYEVGPAKKTSKGVLGAWYAHFVELGTVKQPAQPFLRPAFVATKDKAINAFVVHMNKALIRAAKRLNKK